MMIIAPEFPPLYKKQYDAFYDVRSVVVTHASTKAGKSVGAMVWLIDEGFRNGGGRCYGWMAPINKQAMRIGYDNFVSSFRKWNPTMEYWRELKTEQAIEVHFKGRVHCRFDFFGSEDPNSIYGHEYWGGVVDEASRCKEESWVAFESTATFTNGRFRLIGNMRGRSNWTYRLAQESWSGNKDIGYHKITAYDAVDAGVLDVGVIESRRKRLPDPVFKELYLAEPVDTANAFFNGDVLARQRAGCDDPLFRAEIDSRGLVRTSNGRWLFWSEPGRDRKYVVGADPAYGTGSANSCACVLDCETGRQVAEYSDPYILPYDFARVLSAACIKVFNNARLIWESNGPGEGFYQHAADAGCHNLYFEVREGTLGNRPTRRYGWRSTRSKKRSRLIRLHAAMADNRVGVASADLMNEADRYLLHEGGDIGPDTFSDMATGARESHGDRVIAIMLANALIEDGPGVHRDEPIHTASAVSYGELFGTDDILESSSLDPFHVEHTVTR